MENNALEKVFVSKSKTIKEIRRNINWYSKEGAWTAIVIPN